ncbi:MAG TPA: HypC/HybG/HupF family hydrogenase formation chaperone [Tepidisphaeraceae bacterium]|jgi:hydrogenase expression/formation protein HypC
MCLGIPGKVVRTFHEHDVLMGKVDFGGVSKQVCLEHVPDVQIGQYVLVHVGFALSKIDEDEARLVFEFLGKMKQLDELSVASPNDSPGSAAVSSPAGVEEQRDVS